MVNQQETIPPSVTEEHTRLLIETYHRWTGQALMEIDEMLPLAPQLFTTKNVIVLSHGTQADPVLNYGNEMALSLWEMDWAEFTRTPSRFTAEPMERSARQQFFKAVTEQGYVDIYTGIRVSSTGRRFYIEQATVWNLIDRQGDYHGQAAAFRHYRYCD